MPALNVIVSADASAFNRELATSVNTAKNWASKVQSSVAPDYATILNQGDVKKALSSVESGSHGAHGAVKDLRKGIRSFGFEGSEAIEMIAHALKSPLFLGIGIALGGLWLLDKALKALSPIADSLGLKSLAPQMEKFKSKSIESKSAILEWADGLKRGRSEADKLSDSLQVLTNTTEAWADADERVAEAKKDLALAQVKQLENTGQISKAEAKSRSNSIEAARDQDKLAKANAARNVVNSATNRAAEKAEKGSEDARKSVPGLNAAYLDAQRKADANEERIKNAQENLRQLKKKKDEVGAADFARMGGNAATRVNQGVLDSATEAQPGLLAGAKGAKTDLEKAEQAAIKLREDADRLRREQDAKSTKGVAQFKADKEVAALKAQQRQLESDDGAAAKSKLFRGHLTNLQQVGAYTSPASMTLIDVTKRSEKHLSVIATEVKRLGGNPKFGGVKY